MDIFGQILTLQVLYYSACGFVFSLVLINYFELIYSCLVRLRVIKIMLARAVRLLVEGTSRVSVGFGVVRVARYLWSRTPDLAI